MRTLHTAPLLRHTPDGEPVPEYAVLVDGDRVQAVGPLAELSGAYEGVRLRRWPGTLGPGLLHDGPLPAAPTPRERVHALLRHGVTAVLAEHLADPALRAAVDRSDLLVLPAPVAVTLRPGGRADLAVYGADDACLVTVVAGRIAHRRARPHITWPASHPMVGQRAELRRSLGIMSVPNDPDPRLQSYADPQRLVTTEWLAEHLGDEGLVVVESDEDVLLYESGHIPGAVKVDWHLELNDQVTRDYLDAKSFAELCAAKGIGRGDTVVFYGDNFNWWAAYALWVFSLFGHADVRLLDGGRQKWIAEGREVTRDKPARPRADYPVPQRDDAPLRAYREQVMAHVAAGRPLVDVRSPGEYTGEMLHMPDYPQEGALRGGHIPGAVSKPWKSAANEDGTFKSADELKAIYADQLGLSPDDDVIAYCRIGERSSHTWFVLRHLLGYPQVRNYDGSWTEWGNLVRAPVVKGDQPGGLAN